MTGSDHNPVVRRKSMYVLKVLEPVVPGLDTRRTATSDLILVIRK